LERGSRLSAESIRFSNSRLPSTINVIVK
jgi:hypothetical protein